MSIYNEISKEMHPMMSAFMEDPETRKIMLEAVGDAQKVLEQRARKNMKPTVECRHSGETPQFDTLVEAIKYATVKRITGPDRHVLRYVRTQGWRRTQEALLEKASAGRSQRPGLHRER